MKPIRLWQQFSRLAAVLLALCGAGGPIPLAWSE